MRRFRAETARAVPQRGRLMPMVSVRIAMVLAVKRPWQDPMPGQALSSQTWSSFSLMTPAL